MNIEALSKRRKEQLNILLRLFVARFKSRRGIHYLMIALIASTMLSPLGSKLFGSPRLALADSDPVIVAAGDIACDPAHVNFRNGAGTSDSCRQKYTADLIANINPAAVLSLGDNQYYCGSYQAYMQSYELSWGRFKDITRPVVGNHEYIVTPDPKGPSTDCTTSNAGAQGYFDYFGAAAGNPAEGYYSYDIGAWHIIALNSNCSDAGGCNPDSPQGQWLRNELITNSNFCTLAYWHIPLFSSSTRHEPNSRDLWKMLYDYNADLILTSHEHIYERFAPQTVDGVRDPARGLRQFIVGSGGANHTAIDLIAANSEVRNADTYGVLKLTLHPTSYDWEFVPEAGKTFADRGTGACHGATPDTVPPTAPSNLTASFAAGDEVHLDWTPASDNIAVTGYKVFRDGVQIGFANGASYVDTTTQSYNTYSYSVTAVDGVELESGPSNAAAVTPFGFFNDDFEGNSLARWTVVSNLATQPQEVLGGSYAARGVSNNTPTYAHRYLKAPQNELFYRIHFKLINQTQTTNLLKFRTATGTSILGVFVSNTGVLGSRNDVIGMSTFSTTPVTKGVWHELQVRVLVNDSAGQAEIWLDGNRVSALSKPENFGLSPIGRLQLGENAAGVNFDIAYDNISADTQFISSSSTPTLTPTSTATGTATNTPTQTPTFTATSTITSTATATSTLPSVLTFAAGADTYVQSDTPTRNYGAAVQMVTDSSPVRDMLLKFTVSGVGSSPVVSAKLRVYCVDPSPSGGQFYRLGDTAWGEGTVNWNTAPAADPNVIASLGRVTAWTWYEVDVTSLIAGDGTYAWKVRSSSTDGAYYSTKEGTAGFAPQLVITTSTGSGPTITPTATSTATATSTPTRTSTVTPTATSTSIAGGPVTFLPTADAYVYASSPATNYGSLTMLRADASPDLHSYLRFNVQGLNGSVSRATLRIFANTALSAGITASGVSNTTWTEGTVNYNNAPPLGSALGSSGPIGAGVWISIDVTGYITGNGTYNLAITTPSSTAVSLASRETGANAPQLVIETSP